MNDIRSFRIFLFVLIALTAVSCSSGYQLVKAKRSEYQISKDVTADSTIIKTYLPYKAQIEVEMNQVIGHSEMLMPKADTIPENLLSNFFADAVMEQALKLDPSIDFAMPSTKGGMRVAIPKGEIKMSNIFELMPFENELIAFTLSGKDVQNLLNFIASTNGQPVSALRLKITDKQPADVWINGKPFDVNRNYRVLTSDYIANGGDNVQSFKAPLDKKILGLKVRDALVKYVKEMEASGKAINSKSDGRIIKD